MKNQFRPEKYRDHTICANDGEVVGHIRVKVSGILWAPKGAKVWYGLSLDRFSTLMQEHGKQQKK